VHVDAGLFRADDLDTARIGQHAAGASPKTKGASPRKRRTSAGAAAPAPGRERESWASVALSTAAAAVVSALTEPGEVEEAMRLQSLVGVYKLNPVDP
jgi:hypothetical protein